MTAAELDSWSTELLWGGGGWGGTRGGREEMLGH